MHRQKLQFIRSLGRVEEFAAVEGKRDNMEVNLNPLVPRALDLYLKGASQGGASQTTRSMQYFLLCLLIQFLRMLRYRKGCFD